MRLSPRIVLATLNRHKLEEFQAILEQYPEIELVPAWELLRNAENLRFAETYSTYLDNAAAKARLCNLGTHYPSLADDSGLEVDALGGKPGPLSHRYAPPQPKMSQDQANNELLLSELKQASQRSARFVCTLALVIEGILVHSTGILEGSIIEQARGTAGFGYDPLFGPKGETRTLAEMGDAEKNKISHRAKAVHQLMVNIRSHGITFAKP
jgi:XTP/dITP diphosphohydrolase